MAGNGTADNFGPLSSAGIVDRVGDTQMGAGEADTSGSVGAMGSAASEGGNISVCEADTAGSTGRLYCAGIVSDACLMGCDDTLGSTGTVGSVGPI